MYILSICLFVYFYILHDLQSIRFCNHIFSHIYIFFLHHSTPSPRKIKYQVDGKQKYISSVMEKMETSLIRNSF